MSRCSSSPSWLDLTMIFVSIGLLLTTTSCQASRLFPITTSLGIASGNPVIGSANVNETIVDEEEENSNGSMRCDDARLRCAYRTGCGRALQHYLTRCAAVLHGDVNECPEDCQHALIGLMSTDEGKELMTCNCMKDDLMCRVSKQRVEICRASVTMTMKRTRVSCRVATWICNADALCSTALSYYNENCKRMFHGKKCTKRCRNSINILRRQEKAAKLNTCFCDGAEEYDCNAIHRNMDELCFNKPPTQNNNYQEQQLGPGDGGGGSGGSGGSVGVGAPGISGSGDTRTNRVSNNRATTTVSASWRILLLGLVLLLHSTTG